MKLFQIYVDIAAGQGRLRRTSTHDAKAFETKATAMFAREPWVVADIATNAPDLVGHYGIDLACRPATSAAPRRCSSRRAAPNAACSWDFIKFLTRARTSSSTIPPIAGWLPARAGPRPDRPSWPRTRATRASSRSRTASRSPLTPPIAEFDEIETKLATHLVDAYADYANLAGNPDKIQALLNTWADETNADPGQRRPRQLRT